MQFLNKPVAAICLTVAAAVAHAEDTAYDFNIPPQPVSQVLDSLGKKTGLQPVYADKNVQGISSPGVKGRHSLREAVAKALTGTGLTFQFTAEKSVAIKMGAAESVVRLATVEVRGEADYGSSYAVSRSSTATKTDTPLLETPFSIQVVPREVMDDQQSTNLKDALRNVSGVSPMGDRHYDGVTIRGFMADGATTVYRNGLRIRRAQNDLAAIENIEVLKGPAGAIYGRIEPGGLINLVTKKPQEKSHYSIQQDVGSYGHYRTTGDATGALNEDGTLLYRVVGSYMKEDTFVDNVFATRNLIAPSLTWRPSAQTEVNVNYEKQHEKSRYWAGIPIVNGRPANIPINTYLGFGESQDKEYQVLDKEIFGFDWSHKFSDDWQITHRFHNYRLNYQFNNTWYVANMAADGHTLNRGLFYAPEDMTNAYATNLDINGKFDWIGFKHDVLLGMDYFQEKNQGNSYDALAPIAYRSIDIYAPVSTPIAVQQQPNSWSKSYAEWTGFYMQDQMLISQQWKLLLGGRWDNATTWSGASAASYAAAESAKSTVKDSKFNPRVGLLYQPRSWLTLYGNYVESMGAANTGTTVLGGTFEPEMAQQKEVGFKAELLDKRLVANLALFDLTKQNVKTPDPDNFGSFIAVGEVRNRGLELDVTGEVTNNLSIVAAYAYIDSEITKDNSGNQGKRMFNTPTHSGSLWGKYAFGGDWQGLALGAGVVAKDQYFANNTNTAIIPGYGRIDVALSYKWRSGPSKLTAQLNIENLSDRVYFAQGGYAVGKNAYPGAPRTIMTSLKAEF